MKLKTKAQAVKLFGSQANLARALGISRSSLCEWEDQLTQRRAHEIMGAMVTSGLADLRRVK